MYSVQGSALFDEISVFVIYIFCTGFSSVCRDQRICHICILYRVQLCLIRPAYLLYIYSVQGSTLFDDISVFVIYVFCTGFISVWWHQRICHICILYRVQLCLIISAYLLYMYSVQGSALFDEISVFVIYILYRVQLCLKRSAYLSYMYSVQGSTLFDKTSVFVIYVFCTGFNSVWYQRICYICILYRVQLCLMRSAYLPYMCSVQGSTLFDEISVFVIYVFCTGFSSVWWDQRICYICILYRVQLCLMRSTYL